MSVQKNWLNDRASGLDTRAAMQFVTAGIDDVFQDLDEELSKGEQSRQELCDMVSFDVFSSRTSFMTIPQ